MHEGIILPQHLHKAHRTNTLTLKQHVDEAFYKQNVEQKFAKCCQEQAIFCKEKFFLKKLILADKPVWVKAKYDASDKLMYYSVKYSELTNNMLVCRD